MYARIYEKRVKIWAKPGRYPKSLSPERVGGVGWAESQRGDIFVSNPGHFFLQDGLGHRAVLAHGSAFREPHISTEAE